jgi:glycosyltransferase involved in cell wall biosynthesis
MRIAYFHGAPLPSRAASTVQVMKMCEAFETLGHSVHLFVPDRPDIESCSENMFEFYGVRRFSEVSRCAWPKLPGRMYISALDMGRRARRIGADLAYCRFLAGAFAAAILGTPVVLEAHRPYSDYSRTEQLLFHHLIGSSKFLYLVAISAALARRLERDAPQLIGKVIVAHDAADVAPARVRTGSAAPLRLQVGYVGSLYPGKGIEIILPLAERSPFADFHIIGGGENDALRLQNMARGLPNVQIRGFLPHPKALQELAKFDVLLAPYGETVSVFGDDKADVSAYMSPLKLFEYMAAGKAIICSDHEVLMEVVTPDENALVCRRGDLEAWAAALRRLFEDPTFRERLGAAAFELCARKYSWHGRARQVLSGLSHAA